MKSKVSLVKYTKSPHSLKEALDLCNGFGNLNKDGSVLIKPNLVTWDDDIKISPFGVFTTTRLVEDLVTLLKDYGCRDITIGEGSVVLKKSVGTMQAFEGLGYTKLAKRYNVKLVDFNQSKTSSFQVQDGFKLNIAKEAIEAEQLINFPVLKTHAQTKVSLGIKNLKGCLKTSSKKFCHNTDLCLEYCFSFISNYIKPCLSIVDGIYALEKGPLHFGNAYRKDVIIASNDMLAADMTAAQTIGYKPEDIIHFREYAKRHGNSLLLDDYEISGEKLEEYIKPLKWDWSWSDDNTGPAIFKKLGISGVAIPKYDETLCSGCSPYANMVNVLVAAAFKGKPLPNVEILNGKKMQARIGYDQTILLGKCIIKANKNNLNINKKIEVKGCPPNADNLIAAIKKAGFAVNNLAYPIYLKQQSEKYNGKEGYSWDFFKA